jgi:signal transduction histidine kinase
MTQRQKTVSGEGLAELQGFETLIARFQSTSESLERSYSQLQERVRELSSELEQEREQRIELERLAVMGEMSMELAHEIRNPLGSIELYASMMDGPYAEQIVRGVRLLNHSVTNILQFGQPIYPQTSALRLDDLITGVGTFLTPLAAEKDVRIVCEVADGARVEGDYELLHRMLLNLMLNALREVESGGAITLKAVDLGGETSITVEDNGPGMSGETLSRIFDPMFSMNRDGCGLGLPIVKRIVDSHGGRIEVESDPEGTRFDIRIASFASVHQEPALQAVGGSR